MFFGLEFMTLHLSSVFKFGRKIQTILDTRRPICYLLAKCLPILLVYLPSIILPGRRKSILEKSPASTNLAPRILELDACTGLVGIAAATLFCVQKFSLAE